MFTRPSSTLYLASFLKGQGWQISPGKSMIFPCTIAVFTISHFLWTGFAVLCLLTQGFGLIYDFCPSTRRFALRLLSDIRSPLCPCHRLVFYQDCLSWHSPSTYTEDFHLIKSCPCRAHTKRCSRTLKQCAKNHVQKAVLGRYNGGVAVTTIGPLSFNVRPGRWKYLNSSWWSWLPVC